MAFTNFQHFFLIRQVKRELSSQPQKQLHLLQSYLANTTPYSKKPIQNIRKNDGMARNYLFNKIAFLILSRLNFNGMISIVFTIEC